MANQKPLNGPSKTGNLSGKKRRNNPQKPLLSMPLL